MEPAATQLPPCKATTGDGVSVAALHEGEAATLRVRVDGGAEREVGVGRGVLRVGRAPDMALRVDHPTVSWFHGALFVKPDGLYVLDVRSTNGLFVDGRKVEHARLEQGQTFSLGPLVHVTVVRFSPGRGR
jgi:pSer/pThr/pTyr-binding forkhead associated (FHA) protein